MASHQYGLGRGLASLIPPKKKIEDKEIESKENTPPFQTAPAEHSSPVQATPNVGRVSSVPIFPLAEESNGNGNGVMEIPVEKISPNPHQPRFHFDKVKLDELAESIREHGILQPLIVTSNGDNYEIIAGERRFQAAKIVGLKTVPVVVRDATKLEKLELSIIENIQRHDLNPIEEAKAYLRLVDEFGMQQEAVAQKMGKSRSAVANTLRLLHLPVEIQRAVAEGKISEGHAKSLLAIENPEKQRAIFELIIKEELTVRETEMKARSVSVRSHIRSASTLSPEIIQKAEHLAQIFGTKVKISPVGKGGKIIIEYYATEDLDGLLRRLEK